MGAKLYLLGLAALGAAGCSGGLQRFAPPGIVKYEDLAKDQPVSPVIAERIEAHKAADAHGFPVLGEQPTKTPEGIAKPERAAMETSLLEQRDQLAAEIGEDRSLAAAEREAGLVEVRDDLSEAVAKDDAAARRERGLPPRPDLEQAN